VQPFEEELDALRSRLARYPVERYPVQHATCQFHLGTLLLQAERTHDALEALSAAESGFAACGMALERAKAANMRGVTWRAAGDPVRARESFERAAEGFRALDRPVEEAAASFNLGLIRADLGDVAGARTALERAERLFRAAGRNAQAAAARREHGSVLLQSGDLDTAIRLLEPAVQVALDSGDPAGAGAAANTLGLSHLGRGELDAAVTAFHVALSAHPRSVRPAEYAMVKANLALAHERNGDVPRALLAAQQALGVTTAAAPVRSQAQQVLDRLPAASGAELFAVLDDEPAERWPQTVREEVVRWADASTAMRHSAATSWVEGQLERPGLGHPLAQTLLSALLELPPPAYLRVVAALVAAVGRRSPEDAESFRTVTRSAMARFPLPQWQRLAATFDQQALEQQQPATWT